MSITADTADTAQRARRYLAGGHSDPKDVLAWREQLRTQGLPVLARALSRQLAERFIGGAAMATDEVDALWQACKADEAFSQARRVLQRRRTGAPNLLAAAPGYPAPSPQRLREQAALMTSKDPDLAAAVRHDWALAMLEADLQRSSAETLGIAGGIWKRRWEFDGKVASLEKSLRHYLAPVERDRPAGVADAAHDRDGRGVTAEDGYLAINAAFVCDLLAQQTEDDRLRQQHAARAANLRTRICAAVQATGYWGLATLAEARFGLGEIDQAVALLGQAARQAPDPWQRETTARQLARLGSARRTDVAETTRVVSALVGEGPRGAACVRTILVGKVGLALSGGGFRASLYHLGVLARLAESDVLRHIEVLSAVSGGSMVGAAYYLRLRELLGSDGEPGRERYVALVEALIDDFRLGTNANLRSALLTDLRVCHAILSGNDKDYSAAVADAVFRTLYSRTLASDPHMGQLAIQPRDAAPDFHPRYHNLQRAAKVPALLLNATSLNTGHCWQFTTSSMGESPFSIVAGADPLPRLRRAYYTDPQGRTVRGVTLSQAVAASACVPGLFAPLTLEGLYDGYQVRLVDGGVHDNQGALALLQEDCSVLIVSDACGQLGLSKLPAGGQLPPLLRSVGIFQERMRQSSYDNLRAAQDGGRLAGLAYVHLKQDLEAAPVDWLNCEDPSREDDQLPATSRQNPTTRYGVWKPHQALLAEIRTDLDVFSDIESAALMASGYMAMDAELKRLVRQVPALDAPRLEQDWFFTPMIPRLRGEAPALARHLEAGAVQFLRLMKLDGQVRRVIIGLAVLALMVLALVIWRSWDHRFSLSVGAIVLTLVGVAGPFLGRYLMGDWSWTLALTDPVGALRSRAARWLGAVGTWLLARWLVPRLTARFLERGQLARLDDGP